MKTLFLDVDSQMDFVFPAGALYVPGAERVLPNLVRLNQGAPHLISTADAHAENDAEFRVWPPHCVKGTLGQRRADALLRGQPVIEKVTLDCFGGPELDERIRTLAPERMVVYGVATEYCVKFAVEGLLRHGRPVTLVTDAIAAIDGGEAERLFAAWRAQGVRLATTDEVLAAAATG